MLHLGPYTETLAGETWDALICDPPYSERTHTGHNDGAATADRMRDHLARMEARVAAGLPATLSGEKGCHNDREKIALRRATIKLAEQKSQRNRRAIEYLAWTPDDVRSFVDFCAPRTRGWMVAMCDHTLLEHYWKAMARHDRYVFDFPIPWVASGSRVRMGGDGPACWTCMLAVSRPKTAEAMRWRSLPGAYLYTSRGGESDGTAGGRDTYIGGKPLDLMRAIVRDYSRPGDTVCDPTAGWGTTLRAAQETGRLWLGSEMDPHAHAVATKRLAQPYTPPLFDDARPAQTGIFDEADR